LLLRDHFKNNFLPKERKLIYKKINPVFNLVVLGLELRALSLLGKLSFEPPAPIILDFYLIASS
jgi:hypothetical protein